VCEASVSDQLASWLVSIVSFGNKTRRSMVVSCCYLFVCRKYHALDGNLMAFFMLEILESALHHLMTFDGDIQQLLKSSQTAENTEVKAFQNEPVPDFASRLLPFDQMNGIDPEVILKRPTYCHTARLPAEIRHRGILTETRQTGFWDHEKAIAKKEADANENPSDRMRLVMDDGSRQVCDEVLEMDYKDYFYVNEKEGTKKLVIPNAAEKLMYNHKDPLLGVIMVCFATCSWGKCPAGNVASGEVLAGQGEMWVNGEKVVGFTQISGCSILQHAKGFMFKSNGDGQYEVSAKVLQDKSYMRISSVTIW
jgi:hypothetical protein